MERVKAKRRPRFWNRWRRAGMAANAAVAVAAAAALAGMLNFLAQRHVLRINLRTEKEIRLSAETQEALGKLQEDITAYFLARGSEEHAAEISGLLRGYELFSPHVKVLRIDPDRDLGLAAELSRRHNLSESGAVIFEGPAGARVLRGVTVSRFADPAAARAGWEELFNFAILAAAATNEPVVYFLQGHGEKSPDDYGDMAGYSMLARQMRLNRMRPALLNLAEAQGRIPADCAALVIAGPTRVLPNAEIDIIQSWLERGGRLLLLTDSADAAGLRAMLEIWGVGLAAAPFEGAEGAAGFVPARRYAAHPITEGLKNIATVFFKPVAVFPIGSASADKADRPKAAGLAFCRLADSADADTLKRIAAETDAGGRSFASAAAAAERGPAAGMDVDIPSTRMVVIGDSVSAANAALRAGYAADFFIAAAAWLLDRPAASSPARNARSMTAACLSYERKRAFFLGVICGPPAAVCLAGLAVFLLRRRQ